MSTTTFDPFRSLDRTFDRLLNDGLRAPSTAVMPMDLYREGESFVAHIDLPGVDPASIDIDVEDRTLTVRAERQPVGGGDADGATWLSRERPSGTFARQLSLGRGLALDRISADYQDGVLTLTIPVAEEAKPRKVTVSHAGSARAISSDSHDGSDSGGSGASGASGAAGENDASKQQVTATAS